MPIELDPHWILRRGFKERREGYPSGLTLAMHEVGGRFRHTLSPLAPERGRS